MADDRHNRKDESHFKNRLLPRLSYKTYMADDRPNRRDESRFKNRLLPRLSYKNYNSGAMK
ncbi:hypothetical protein MTBBW1_1070010 [Desulfamplus magnetovallimortis]|uniref:Uncharacterized protein n=1 Tax=Desulfamplus magnetovallimortis TaxID=1246637 RepID=A0A1W1H5H4_9BACT|nr:hypothetical protein MTBBW1_1070010 [Desulfamplus magnetovallimortis]